MPVEIKGLDETLKALRQFEPDLAKNLNKQVRSALTPIQKHAREFVPDELPGLSNWTFSSKGNKITKQSSAFAQVGHFPKFNASIVRRGIQIQIGKSKPNRNGFVSYFRIANKTAAGAIMETAGRKNPAGQPWVPGSGSHNYSHSRNPEAGLHFINSMGGRMVGQGKKRGRLIYRAYEEDQGRTTATIVRAVDMTVAVFNRRAQAQALRKVA